MDVPTSVELTRCATGQVEFGIVRALLREDAKTKIDGAWWSDLTQTLRAPANEPDRHWPWHVLISKNQNKHYFDSKCIVTADGLIQAAMLYRVDALSVFEEGKPAIFVDRLATSPRNRDGLVETPLFRGSGTGLLMYAIALSYSLGFQGRVNLIPIASEDFYRRMGFLPTTSVVDGDTLFEMPDDGVLSLLRARGLIDG